MGELRNTTVTGPFFVTVVDDFFSTSFFHLEFYISHRQTSGAPEIVD